MRKRKSIGRFDVFDEKSKIDIIEYLKNSGVSIKMRNTNYQIDKCSIKKFVARFKDKERNSYGTDVLR